MCRAVCLALLLWACRYGFDVDRVDDGGVADSSDAVSADAVGGRNLVFVTTARLTGAQVRARGGGDMLAGGDVICAEHAMAGGLPGTFIALLSGPSVNAIDRLAGSRGWYRLDGLPFADTPASLFGNRDVYYPVVYDELGVAQPTRTTMTGTGEDGVVNSDCNGWTSASTADRVFAGNSTDGSTGWSSRYIPDCSVDLHLYCFGIGHDVPVTIIPQSGRRAFVSNPWSPVGGLTGADAHCQLEATTNSVPGVYRALLATTTASAASRFNTTGPTWVRLDGVPIAATANDLFDRNLMTALSLKADGTNSGGVLWSGTGDPRTAGVNTCSNWTVNTGASSGRQTVASNGPGTFFTETYTGPCTNMYGLYCLEE